MSCWYVNIKLVLTEMKMGLVSSKVSTIFVICDLSNINNLKIHFQGFINKLDAIFVRKPGDAWSMNLEIIFDLPFRRGMRSGQR